MAPAAAVGALAPASGCGGGRGDVTAFPWDPDRSQATCSNGLDCAGRQRWEPEGMLVVAMTLDEDGRCAQCVARERVPAPPEPEPVAALFDPDGAA